MLAIVNQQQLEQKRAPMANAYAERIYALIDYSTRER